MDNLKPVPEMHYDITPPNRFSDIIACWQSIRRIRDRAESPDKILTTHDRDMLRRAEEEPVIGLGGKGGE